MSCFTQSGSSHSLEIGVILGIISLSIVDGPIQVLTASRRNIATKITSHFRYSPRRGFILRVQCIRSILGIIVAEIVTRLECLSFASWRQFGVPVLSLIAFQAPLAVRIFVAVSLAFIEFPRWIAPQVLSLDVLLRIIAVVAISVRSCARASWRQAAINELSMPAFQVSFAITVVVTITRTLSTIRTIVQRNITLIEPLISHVIIVHRASIPFLYNLIVGMLLSMNCLIPK